MPDRAPAFSSATETLHATPPSRKKYVYFGAAIVAGLSALPIAWQWSIKQRPAAPISPPLPAPILPPPATITQPEAPSSAPPEVAAKKAPPAKHGAGQVGFLTVTAEPWGALYVDGERVANETPVYRLRLPAGQHRVAIAYPSGKRSRVQRVKIEPNTPRTIGFMP
jgi:hypothetical protein